MKTKFKTAVLAIALMVGTTGVFATDISNAFRGKPLTTYSWQKFHRDGTPDGTPLVNTSPNNPFLDDCTGGSNLKCAVGTPEEGEPIIYNYPN